MDDSTLFQQNQELEKLTRTVASLVVVRGADIGKQLLIRRNDILIGRGPDCDLILMDKKASRHHAVLKVTYAAETREVVHLLEDLESTNHVYYNGHMVRTCRLNDGDKIQIGDTILRFSLQDQVDSQFHDTIQKKIQFDTLTGLMTLDSFQESVQWEIENRVTPSSRFSLIMMDIDDFKKVNDTFGHLMGSQVLKELGALIANNIRNQDFACRYGGEEFVLLMQESDSASAWRAAERLREVIAAHRFTYDGQEVQITISMGISQYPEHGPGMGDLIAAASCVERNALLSE